MVAGARSAAQAGRSREAWELFVRAWPLARRSPLAPRGICRLALALGIRTEEQRADARSACHNALMLGGTAEDMRNEEASLVMGTVLPSMDDLVSASFAMEGAVRTGPGQPWGDLARGDLAFRLGDREMLNDAISNLRRVSPDGDETRKLIERSSSRSRASGWTWVGRATVALLFLFTAGHALRRRWRRRGSRAGLSLAAVLTLLILLPASAARADAGPQAAAKLAQTGDPLVLAGLLMNLTARAEKETSRGDHAAAARDWAAVTTAVPERSYGFARLCDSLEASGHPDQAVAACRTALTRQGTTAGDYTHFVKLLLATNATLSASDRKQIDVALGQLDKEPRAALIAENVRCNVAAHEHDRAGLEACTAKLTAAAPNDRATILFALALAVDKSDRAAVGRLTDRARAAGIDEQVLANALRVTRGPSGGRWARALRWAVDAVLGFLLLTIFYKLGARGFSAARRRLAAS